MYQGSTFTEVFRWESGTKIYKVITGITKSAPMVVTAVGHGMPIGWRGKISNVIGMKEVNSDNYLIATDADTDTVTFNEINAVGYTTYISGGILEYNEPKSLAGLTARMQIRPKVNSTEILETLTTENGKIIVNDSNKTITIVIDAVTTALYTFKSAVYSVELISGSVVTPFIYGNITLESEITR